MYQIKVELSQILGKIENLEKKDPIDPQDLYTLLKEAYFIISDSFDIEQCHSTIHQIKADMRDLDRLDQDGNDHQKRGKVIEGALKNCKKELEIFISHL